MTTTEQTQMPPSDGSAAKPPATIEQFAAMAASLPRMYSNQQLDQAWRALDAAPVELDNVDRMCQALGQLRMPHSGEVLARKWNAIPGDARQRVLAWAWEGKEKQQIVTNALAAAAKIGASDPAAALELLRIAVERSDTETAQRTAVILLRESWLHASAQDKPRPFEMVSWSTETRPWRHRFADLLAQAALNKYAGPKDKQVGPGVRQAVAEWLRKAMESPQNDEERMLIQQQVSRLAPQAQQTSGDRAVVDAHISPSDEQKQDAAQDRELQPDQNSQPRPAGPSQPARREGGKFKRLLDALRQVQRAVEDLDGNNSSDSSEVGQLKAEAERLRRAEHALRVQLDEANAQAKQRDFAIRDLSEQLDESRNLLKSAQGNAETLTAALDELRRESEHERLRSRQHTQVERDEAIRGLTQRLAEQLRHDVRNLRGAEQRPPSPEQAKFVIDVANGMLQRLKANGIQIE